MVRLDTKVGMFWCVGEKVIGEAVSLSQAEPYGDALQHGGHYDFWCGLKPQTIAERQLKSHAYDFYPRGRVVYFQTRQQFRLYVDGCVKSRNRVNILKFFGLVGDLIEIEMDAHYQCARCNLLFLDEL